MNIEEILVIILSHMDDVSVYCFYQTSKTNKKFLSKLIQNRIICVREKYLIDENLCTLSTKYGYLKILHTLFLRVDLGGK